MNDVIDGGNLRLALISKHFPPSEEAGALRWQKLSGHAVRHGFSLRIATRRSDELTRRDDRRLLDLPPGTELLEVGSVRTLFDMVDATFVATRRLVRTLRWREMGAERPLAYDASPRPVATQTSISRSEARSPFASLADLRRAYHATALRATELAWARHAARALAVAAPAPHAIITCGPPHQVHLAGATLARRWAVPHIVDMRDPWSLVERVPAPFGSTRLWASAAADEAAVFARASLVVVNTEAHATALRELMPQLGDRLLPVLNGFDDDDVPPPNPQPAFTVVYAGTVYLDRDPAMLLLPIADLVRRDRLTPAELQVVFVGDVEDAGGGSLADVSDGLGLRGFVQVRGRVPRSEAMSILATADLTVVLPQDSHLAVPSKVYEYLRFHAWMLALAEPHSATAQTLADTGADVLRPGDREAVVATVARRIAERKALGRPTPLAHGAPQLSRRAQADRLFCRIARLLGR